MLKVGIKKRTTKVKRKENEGYQMKIIKTYKGQTDRDKTDKTRKCEL